MAAQVEASASRAAAEQAQREPSAVSEEQFGAALDAVPDVVFVFTPQRDASGTIVDMQYRNVNAAGLQMFGLPAEAIVGHGYLELFPAERGSESWRRGLAVLETGEGATYDVSWPREGGDAGTFAVRMAPFGDGLILSVRDISERLRIDEQLRHERDLVEAMLDVAGAVIVVTDADGHVVRFNRQAELMTGYREAEVVGRHYGFLFPPSERAQVVEIVDQASGERPVSHVNHYLTKDGEVRLFRWSHAALYDADGRRTHRIGIGIDITEQRQAEEELARRADQCEVANRELDRSNKDLEQFAHIASHDLQEPLRAITLPIELVAQRYRGRLDTDADEFLSFALEGCRRMQERIHDLLELSRVGRVDSPTPRTDAGRVVDDAIAGLKPTLDAAHAVIDVEEPLPVVLADPGQLALVFENLICNAVKFVAPGVTPHVTIAAEPVGPMRRFTVTDNGIGIQPRSRERVFTMFARLHPADDYPGTGIGLALVKKIVEGHHGEVGVDEAPGATGSRFWFTLPAPE